MDEAAPSHRARAIAEQQDGDPAALRSEVAHANEFLIGHAASLEQVARRRPWPAGWPQRPRFWPQYASIAFTAFFGCPEADVKAGIGQTPGQIRPPGTRLESWLVARFLAGRS